VPVFYAYTFALRGTQTTVNGAPNNYAFAPSGTWSYTGNTTYFVVEENDGATVFNGDGDVNEEVDPNERIGGAWEQTTTIDGTPRQVIWDYTFEVTDGTTTWRIAVIDVDLNNDNDLNDGTDAGADDEDGYFLVFPDGMPPPDTDLTIGGIVANGDNTPHLDLGASSFALPPECRSRHRTALAKSKSCARAIWSSRNRAGRNRLSGPAPVQ